MASKNQGVEYYPLILNSSNVVPGSNNSQFRYRFPSGSALFKNSQLALGSVGLYYSYFNITASNNNNTLSYRWYNNAGSAVYNITIQDGYYSVSDLNSYLQGKMIANGHYLVDNSGNYVYYLELVENSTYYSVQFNSYPIPTTLPVGWTNPAAITFPAVATTPQIIIPSTNIRNLLGFSAGTYPSPVQATNYSKLSDFVPQLAPVQSIIMLCDLLNNRYSNPQTVLYSFTPSNVIFGAAIESKPINYAFIPISDGSYDSLLINFVDQNFNPITFQDPNIIIQLIVQTRTQSLSY